MKYIWQDKLYKPNRWCTCYPVDHILNVVTMKRYAEVKTDKATSACFLLKI